MGTAERRLEILKFLCRKRHATMPELAKKFDVSIRTIQRDIYEIEATFHAPLVVKSGRYQGGVYVIGDYSFDRAYMHDEELALLAKVKCLVKDMLSEQENALLSGIINTYTKTNAKDPYSDASCQH